MIGFVGRWMPLLRDLVRLGSNTESGQVQGISLKKSRIQVETEWDPVS